MSTDGVQLYKSQWYHMTMVKNSETSIRFTKYIRFVGEPLMSCAPYNIKISVNNCHIL